MIDIQTGVCHAASYARVDKRLTGSCTLGILDRDRSLVCGRVASIILHQKVDVGNGWIGIQ
jgi:hypothetical protein